MQNVSWVAFGSALVAVDVPRPPLPRVPSGGVHVHTN